MVRAFERDVVDAAIVGAVPWYAYVFFAFMVALLGWALWGFLRTEKRSPFGWMRPRPPSGR